MRDQSPLLLRRMLVLRQFPLFAHAELGELAVIAENVAERSFVAGDLVAPAAHVRSLHFVLDGHLAHGSLRSGPRHVFGALEVLGGRAARMPAFAGAPTRTLELAASDYVEVLEDNFGLLLATVRDLAARMIPLGDLRHRAHPFAEGQTLGLVERMIVLRQQTPFAAARLEALAILAHAATEVHFEVGSVLRRTNTPADGALILLEGSTRRDRDQRILGPGHAIGTLETLANLHHTATYEAVTPIRALESHAATILDVLEDHTDLALAMMQTFARSLIDDESRMVCAPRSEPADPARDPASQTSSDWRTS